jgi:hypothetical protein
MNHLKHVTLVSAALTLAGCVPSLHPLHTEETLAEEPSLAGAWTQEEETWTFAPAGHGAYTLVIARADEDPETLEAHLVRLGDDLYLDMELDERPEVGDYANFHLFPVHSFWRVWREGDGLRLAALDPEKFWAAVEAQGLTIAHEEVEGHGKILTAPTAEIQAVLPLVADEAFGEPGDFRRLGSEEADQGEAAEAIEES